MREPFSPEKTSGFSLIEVLIAVVVLSFGLLGMGLLQTMSMRSGQTANHRTQATNLAYEIIDMIRANKSEIGNYNTIDFGDFTTASTTATTCNGALAISTTGMRYAQDRQLWICDVRAALPQGEGQVRVDDSVTPSIVTIQLRWLEDRSKSDASAATRDSADTSDSQWTGDDDFTVTTSI